MENQLNINSLKYRRLSLKEIKDLAQIHKEDKNYLFELSKQKSTLEDLPFFYSLFSKFSLNQYLSWVGRYYMDEETIRVAYDKFPEASQLIARLLRCQIIQSENHKDLKHKLFASLGFEEIEFQVENCFLDDELIEIIIKNYSQNSRLMLLLFCRKQVRKNDELSFRVLKLIEDEETILSLLDKKYYLSVNLLKNIWIRFPSHEIAYKIIQRANSREEFDFYMEVFNFVLKGDLVFFLDPDKNDHLSIQDCYLAYKSFSDDEKILKTLNKLEIVKKDKVLNSSVSMKLQLME